MSLKHRLWTYVWIRTRSPSAESTSSTGRTHEMSFNQRLQTYIEILNKNSIKWNHPTRISSSSYSQERNVWKERRLMEALEKSCENKLLTNSVGVRCSPPSIPEMKLNGKWRGISLSSLLVYYHSNDSKRAETTEHGSVMYILCSLVKTLKER